MKLIYVGDNDDDVDDIRSLPNEKDEPSCKM